MNGSKHTNKTKKREEMGKTVESTESVKDPALTIKGEICNNILNQSSLNHAATGHKRRPKLGP